MKKRIRWLILALLAIGLFARCQSESIVLRITVENPLEIVRASETIVIKLKDIKDRIPAINPVLLQISEANSGAVRVSQLVDNDEDGEHDDLLFQADFTAGETRTFLIRENAEKTAHKPESKVYAKFVPTRMDDFAWENDRIAYRMYGPALQATGEISSGVDVWVKSVRHLILDKWYQSGNDYHTDHGEGLDYYKVGPSCGCGGSAVWDGKQLIPSKNFTDWKIIANGPIRTIFVLAYAPWDFNGTQISEVKRISLDAGQNLNRFESFFSADEDAKELTCAIGIVRREGEGDTASDLAKGWLGYWEPGHKKYGNTGCGIVVNPSRIIEIKEIDNHNLVIAKGESGKPVVYFAGAAWSKSGDFANAQQWYKYMEEFALSLQSPIKVQIQ